MAAVTFVGTPSPLVTGTPVVPSRPTVSNEPLPLNPANLNPSAVPVQQQPNVEVVVQQPAQPVQPQPVKPAPQAPVPQPVNVTVNQPKQ